MSRSLGLLTASTDPCLCDSVVAAGMQYLWLDAEHTGLTAAEVERVVHRVSSPEFDVLVRVPSNDFDTIATFANTGVDELVLPRLRTVEELRSAWESMRFPPDGVRPRQVVAATGWGTEHSAQPRLSVIVETVDAADALAEFIDSGLVSAWWLGQKDLRDDHLRRGGDEAGLAERVERVLDLWRQADCEFGWSVTSTEAIGSVWDAGGRRCSVYWDQYLAGHLRQAWVAGRDG